VVKQKYQDLFRYIDRLPLHVQIGKLIFVHAGFDLSLRDPINFTTEQDQYWLRESYWYGNNGKKRPVWGHNPLPLSIVSGHTPTSLMVGTYEGNAAKSTLRNRVASPHGILTVQYEHEFPRYFIDAGCHSGPASRIPNLGVLDAETGELIEAVESNDAEDI
jgi:serine/threonine protein phosphatase 1